MPLLHESVTDATRASKKRKVLVRVLQNKRSLTKMLQDNAKEGPRLITSKRESASQITSYKERGAAKSLLSLLHCFIVVILRDAKEKQGEKDPVRTLKGRASM